MHTHIHTRTYIDTYTQIHTHAHCDAHTHTHTHTHMYTHIYVYIYVYTFIGDSFLWCVQYVFICTLYMYKDLYLCVRSVREREHTRPSVFCVYMI